MLSKKEGLYEKKIFASRFDDYFEGYIKELVFPETYDIYRDEEKLKLKNEFTESELKVIDRLCEIDYKIH